MPKDGVLPLFKQGLKLQIKIFTGDTTDKYLTNLKRRTGHTFKLIFEACGENDRAAYGKQVLKYISERMSEEFGKGFDTSNLRNMRRFYLTFPIQDALRPELSWTHYRSLMKVNDEKARAFYMEECAKAGWSSRQLER